MRIDVNVPHINGRTSMWEATSTRGIYLAAQQLSECASNIDV